MRQLGNRRVCGALTHVAGKELLHFRRSTVALQKRSCPTQIIAHETHSFAFELNPRLKFKDPRHLKNGQDLGFAKFL